MVEHIHPAQLNMGCPSSMAISGAVGGMAKVSRTSCKAVPNHPNLGACLGDQVEAGSFNCHKKEMRNDVVAVEKTQKMDCAWAVETPCISGSWNAMLSHELDFFLGHKKHMNFNFLFKSTQTGMEIESFFELPTNNYRGLCAKCLFRKWCVRDWSSFGWATLANTTSIDW